MHAATLPLHCIAGLLCLLLMRTISLIVCAQQDASFLQGRSLLLLYGPVMSGHCGRSGACCQHARVASHRGLCAKTLCSDLYRTSCKLRVQRFTLKRLPLCNSPCNADSWRCMIILCFLVQGLFKP
jgi:hypothetical protein